MSSSARWVRTELCCGASRCRLAPATTTRTCSRARSRCFGRPRAFLRTVVSLQVIHSDIEGSDALSLLDVTTRELRTLRLRDSRPYFHLGASVADAKMPDRRKAWSPRFSDDRYLYAVLHETRTDELGELSVLRIDTENGNIVARWPERDTSSTVRATMWDWTMTAGSVYVVAKDWSAHPYTLYRLEGRDLRPAARRVFDAAPLIRVLPLRGER